MSAGPKKELKRDTAIVREFDASQSPDLLVLYYHVRDAAYDAFKIYDPAQPVPDIRRSVPEPRFEQRVADLYDVVESEFQRGRLRQLETTRTLHRTVTEGALRMMSSQQLGAFDVSAEPKQVLESWHWMWSKKTVKFSMFV